LAAALYHSVDVLIDDTDEDTTHLEQLKVLCKEYMDDNFVDFSILMEE